METNHKLLRLLNMLDSYASNFVWLEKNLDAQLQAAEVYIDLRVKREDAIPLLKDHYAFLLKLLHNLKILDLEQSIILCEEMLENFSLFRISQLTIDQAKEYKESLTILSRIAKNELKSRMFYYVRPDLIEYYQENQFDNCIIEKFPKAKFDMEEAGKCLALGRFSASVFHLMRIVDLGLKKLGEFYGIKPKNPNWGEYITPLREQYNKLKKEKPDEAQTLGDIIERYSAYTGIRNPLSHSDELFADDSIHRIEEKYTEEETKRHLENAKAFMKSLASFLEEGK